MAVDVAFFPIKWGAVERHKHFGFYVLGVAEALLQQGVISHRVRWGGDWDGDKDTTDQRFNDLVHFELVPI